jgi:hypothetical protein
MQQNSPKFTKNWPKLAKSAEICSKIISLKNFEIPPKMKILMFFKTKNLYIDKAPKHVLTI